MRKNATSFSRSGVSDWIAQRVSAYVLGAYFVAIMAFLLAEKGVSYGEWHAFMTWGPMRAFSLLALLALAAHAWVGLWTVLTDYLTERQMGAKATFIRLLFQTGMVISIFVYLIWGIQILWGN